jgi:hypothetical protein
MTRDEVQAVIDEFKDRSARAVYSSTSNAYGDAARSLAKALEKSEATGMSTPEQEMCATCGCWVCEHEVTP